MRAAAVLAVLALAVGCAGKTSKPATEKPPAAAPTAEMHLEELPVPQIEEQAPPQMASGRLYTLRVRDGRLKDVLLALARESGENLVVDPDVTGTVTVDLNQVTLEQALDAVLTPLAYVYRKQGKLIRISKPLMETRIFPLNYINTSRKGEKKIIATHGTGAGEGTRISGSESSVTGLDQLDPWVEIQEGLTAIVFGEKRPEEVVRARKEGLVTSLTNEEGKKLVISRISGVVLVRDYPENLREVGQFLEQVEGSIQRQVLIQARIFEVVLRREYTTGIRWNNIQRQLLNLDISTLSFSYDVAGELTRSGILGVTGTSTDISGNPFKLADLVEALEIQGTVNTLASPKVSTLNNQAAIVKITDQDVYFTSDTTVSEGISEITFTPNVVDIGVILDVTPQIAADGSIIMNIHPSFSEKIKDVPSPDNITTFPLLSVRETDTVVKVRDGQTIIIAGLIKDRRSDTRTGVPCMMSIPILGHLFHYREDISNKSELVILLTPTVLAGRRINEMKAEERRFLEGFK
ncbi:MAG: secretin and TonB N-terminal domain-containing protein [Syntrophobacteria bacterium]